MKIINLFLLLLFVTIQNSFANKIDELKTDSDVAHFIVSLDKRFLIKYTPPFIVRSTDQIRKDANCSQFAESLGVKNWIKADFNNDGHTDLLVNGYWYNYNPYIAIDIGDNNFKLIILGYSVFVKSEVASVIESKSGKLVLFHTLRPDPGPADFFHKDHSQIDTLIYKFDGFVELNKSPSNYNVKNIKFHTGMCYGSCPDFDISIDKSGNAFYHAGFYNKEAGYFKTTIKSDDFNSILSVLNYINLKELRDNYAVSWTDSPTCNLSVEFDDGSVKKIEDYGELGTFGLMRVYSLFFNLRSNQYWLKENNMLPDKK